MQVLLYSRVSTEDQADAGTIEVQEHAMLAYCAKHGHEVVDLVRDDGVSGTVPFHDRPGGSKVIAMAEAQRARKVRDFDALLLNTVDRLARNAFISGWAEHQLTQLKVPIVFVNGSFEDTPEGNLSKGVLAHISQYEREVITRRMAGGRLRSVRSGKYLASTAPFGYKFVPVLQSVGDGSRAAKPTRRLEIDETTAPHVRHIFEMAIQGLGLQQIAKALDAEGVPPPMAEHPRRKSAYPGWSWSTVAKILKARRYVGEGSYGREEGSHGARGKGFGVEVMTCPAIIDEGTFEAARQALRQRRFDNTRNQKNVYVLAGLLVCGHCGAQYHGRIKRQPDGAVLTQYECGRRRVHGPRAGHEAVVWRADERDVLPRIKRAVDDLIADPARAIADYDMQIERARAELPGASGRAHELEARLAGFAQQEQRMLDGYRRGLFDADALGKQMAAIQDERRAVEAELREAKALADDGEGLVATLELVRHWLESGTIRRSDPRVLYDEATGTEITTDDLSPQEWRDRIRQVVQRIVVEDDGGLRLEGPGDVILCKTCQGAHTNHIRFRLLIAGKRAA